MELTFKTKDKEDIETIYSLSRDLIDRYEDLSSIDYEKVLGWMRRKIDQNIAEYVTVFSDGQKAGFYRLSRNGKMAELDDLYILPPFRGRGIGTRIIEKCCMDSDRPVMLYVFTANTGALSLYQRMGFVITEYVGSTRCIMIRPREEV